MLVEKDEIVDDRLGGGDRTHRPLFQMACSGKDAVFTEKHLDRPTFNRDLMLAREVEITVRQAGAKASGGNADRAEFLLENQVRHRDLAPANPADRLDRAVGR